MTSLELPHDWKAILHEEVGQAYFLELMNFIQLEYQDSLCFPPRQEIFRALELCSLTEVKVVILGQDPYHDHRQANGLAFSVRENLAIPPSLRNIFKELHSDLGIDIPTHGSLELWAQQGVLLLNTVLTVRAHLPGSHQNRGWETFTNKIIRTISDSKEHIVFVLWGGYAKKKIPLIDSDKHLIIQSPHPSPLSSYRGFFGSQPFSKINDYLTKHNHPAIDWNLGKSQYQLF